MRKEALKADGILLLTALICGLGFVAQRKGMESIGPLAYNGVRFALAAGALLPLALARSARPRRGAWTGRRRLGALALTGIVVFLAISLQQWGIVYTTAGNASFLTGLYVILVPLLGLLVGHRTGRMVWVGALLALAGAYCLSASNGFSFQALMERGALFGDALVSLSALFWAIHMLMLARFSQHLSATLIACAQFGVCALLSLAASLAIEKTSFASIREATVPILYGGLISVAVGYTLQVVGQRHAPPAHAAILLSLEAVFGAAGGIVLLGERITPSGAVGCALMLTGMLAAQWQTFRSEKIVKTESR
jgi:drug/metabolite transporter (DMT)-like permease